MPYLTDSGAFRDDGIDWPSDVSAPGNPMFHEKFTDARWLSRGWCLQGLIAPREPLVFSFFRDGAECEPIRVRRLLVKTISAAAKVVAAILRHEVPLSSMSAAQKMSWAANRQTRRVEDRAYCLLGMFDANLPTLYGEITLAFIRLQAEIMRTHSDRSIFAWSHRGAIFNGTLLGPDPAAFRDAEKGANQRHSN